MPGGDHHVQVNGDREHLWQIGAQRTAVDGEVHQKERHAERHPADEIEVQVEPSSP